MTATVSELAGILRGAGLAVNTTYAGPGESGTFTPRGLIYHHDAAGLSYVDNWGGRDNTTIAQSMAPKGANGAQFWVGRTGTWYILSSGLKWHAGSGGPWGGIPKDGGNRYTYGIETDYGPVRPGWTGPTITSAGYTWPAWDTQHRQAIDTGSAALADALGLADYCGHKEYAPTRKIDPANVDLGAWRTYIANPEEDDMTPDQVRQAVRDELVQFFTKDQITVSGDDMSTPDTYQTTRDKLDARILRVSSIGTATITGRDGRAPVPPK